MNRSLGGLRHNKNKNQDKQPDYLGRFLFTRETLYSIVSEMESNPNSLIEVGLAGWINQKKHRNGFTDTYLTIEIRSLGERDDRLYKPTDEENPFSNLEQFFA